MCSSEVNGPEPAQKMHRNGGATVGGLVSVIVTIRLTPGTLADLEPRSGGKTVTVMPFVRVFLRL